MVTVRVNEEGPLGPDTIGSQQIEAVPVFNCMAPLDTPLEGGQSQFYVSLCVHTQGPPVFCLEVPLPLRSRAIPVTSPSLLPLPKEVSSLPLLGSSVPFSVVTKNSGDSGNLGVLRHSLEYSGLGC